MNEILNDWKFWLFIVAIIKDIALIMGIVLVKFNDMKHLNIDIKKVITNQDKMLVEFAELKGRCEERHK